MVYFRRFTVNGCVPTPRAANSDSGSSRARLSFTLICEFALMAIYILHGMELLSFNMLGLAMKLTLPLASLTWICDANRLYIHGRCARARYVLDDGSTRVVAAAGSCLFFIPIFISTNTRRQHRLCFCVKHMVKQCKCIDEDHCSHARKGGT